MRVSSKLRPGPRAAKTAELDHHLTTNGGFWWVGCSINATPKTKEKISFSLRTKCLRTARLRRDVFLQGLHAVGLEVRVRRRSAVAGTLGPVIPDPSNRPWKIRVAEVRGLALELKDQDAENERAPEPVFHFATLS